MRASTSRFLVVVALVLTLVAPLAAPAAASTGRVAGPLAPVRLRDLPADDPGVLGPEPVDELAYDLGDEAFAPEGFGAAVELRAKVYAPQVIVGRAPLVVLLHGRHATCADATEVQLEWPCSTLPEIPSYAGYDRLGHLLASRGMVVASIGANGINANDGYLADGGAAARGQLVLEHLRRWQGWDASATGSPFGARFVGHVDLTDVGLMGHSRGGEGVVSAAQLNQRTGSPFGIRAVETLGPVDFGRQLLGGVPLGVVLPQCDGDVSDLQGVHYYDDARYASPGDPAPKQTVLLAGANHNFFNTVWTSGPGSFDDADFGFEPQEPAAGAPCAPDGVARLEPGEQEQAGAALMAGFFRRFLQDDTGMARLVSGTAPFPASTGPARWSVAYHAPDRLDVERFDSPATIRTNRFGKQAELRALASGLVCTAGQPGFFSEVQARSPAADAQEQCPTLGELAVANSTGVLDAGWARPTGVVREPLATAGVDVTHFDGVRFRVAPVSDSRNDARPKQDLSVVLEDADGHRSSVAAGSGSNAFFPVNPTMFRHAVLNGVRVPLTAFVGVDLARIRAVELRFDRTNAGRLAISDLAFTAEGTGSAVGPTAGPPSMSTPRPSCRRTPANRWACALAQTMWGRDPDDAEMARLAAGFASAPGRRRVIAEVVAARTTARNRQARFVQAYTSAEVPGGDVTPYLSSAGRATWETALVELTSTFAFSTSSLGTPRKVVDAAYQAFTGRSADPGGMAYWLPRVESRGAYELAASLVRTASHRGRVVDERYRQILGREPDPSGRAYWVGKLAQAGGEQAMVRSMLDTESFRVAASS